jgi:CP family cyanate transporter-like MFS transporter
MKLRFGYLVCALFLASINLRPAISSIAPLLETMRKDLGINGALASLLTSIPVLCMGLFSPIAVKISNRWGLEKTLTWSLLLIGVGTILRYFAASSLLLLLTAFLAGVGIAITGPLLSGFIKRYFANRASSLVGIYSSAMVIGAALSSGLSVPIQHLFHDSWRASLASWAIFAIVALPVWWRLAVHASHSNSNSTASKYTSERVKLPWRNKRARIITLLFGCMAVIFYSLTAWLAPAFESMGYDKAFAGGILTLFTFIQIPVSFVLPILIARFPKRMYWLLGCAIFQLAGLLVFMMNGNPWYCAMLLGIGAGGLFPIVLMLPLEETGDAETASAWAAMNQSGGYVIGSLGPIFVGWLHDATGSFVPAFGGMVIVVVLMMLLQLIIGNKKEQSSLEIPSQAATTSSR